MLAGRGHVRADVDFDFVVAQRWRRRLQQAQALEVDAPQLCAILCPQLVQHAVVAGEVHAAGAVHGSGVLDDTRGLVRPQNTACRTPHPRQREHTITATSV